MKARAGLGLGGVKTFARHGIDYGEKVAAGVVALLRFIARGARIAPVWDTICLAFIWQKGKY